VNALDLLLTRRSVSARYLIEPGPSAEQIETILTAAIRVPDHGKLAPWRVQIIPRAAREAFTRAALAAYDAEVSEKDEGKREKLGQFAAHAPLMLAVGTKLQRGHKIPEIEQILSCGAFCMNIEHAAAALGFAANWLTGFPAYSPGVKRALGLAADEAIAGFFFIGTAEMPPSERPRPRVDEILSTWNG
jgi:nitroreductase